MAGITSLYPLYLYATGKLTEQPGGGLNGRRPNLDEEVTDELAEKLGLEWIDDGMGDVTGNGEPESFGPEDFFHYAYAVLHSPTYRERYKEFLKIDFPRIPFTKDYELFGKMAEYGEKLVDLHLLKSAELDPPVAKFQGEGDERIEKLRYEEEAKRVYVNKSRYFEGVSKDVWQYQIGGYQVCNKWLKDRKGRRLSLENIKHYCRIVTSLEKTIEIQKAIDGVYSEVEKETVEFGEQFCSEGGLAEVFFGGRC